MRCFYHFLLILKQRWEKQGVGFSSCMRFQHLSTTSTWKPETPHWLSQRPDGTTPKHQDVWVIEPASHEFLKALRWLGRRVALRKGGWMWQPNKVSSAILLAILKINNIKIDIILLYYTILWPDLKNIYNTLTQCISNMHQKYIRHHRYQHLWLWNSHWAGISQNFDERSRDDKKSCDCWCPYPSFIPVCLNPGHWHWIHCDVTWLYQYLLSSAREMHGSSWTVR